MLNLLLSSLCNVIYLFEKGILLKIDFVVIFSMNQIFNLINNPIENIKSL